MNLQKGIQIFFANDLKPSGCKIWLSSGTLKADSIARDGSAYCQNAYIAKLPWREPSALECSLISADTAPKDTDVGRWIGLIRIPDEVLNLLNSIILNQENVEGIVEDRNYQYAVSQVVAYLRRFMACEEGLVVHSIGSNPPGLPYVTYSSASECYIGLHLDSWDKLPFGQTHVARNRICVNLGREDRFLLFINLTLDDMFNAIGISEEGITRSTLGRDVGRTVGYEFMKRFPTYPVTKLRIRPNEAYIAPTENTFHEGCTTGQKHLDLMLTLRGYFQIPVTPLPEKWKR